MTQPHAQGSQMDSRRTPPRRRWRTPLAGVLLIGAAVIAAWTLTSAPAAPVVSVNTLVIDSVVQGDLVNEVRAPGTLVPENVRYLTAQTSARVERLLVEPGVRVRSGDVLLVLSNPDVLTQSLEAEQRVREAQIDLVNLRATLRLQALAQEGLVATMTTEEASASQSRRIADSLFKYRFASQVESTNATTLAREMTTRLRVERERLGIMRATITEQLDAKRGQIAQLRAIATNQRARLQSLEVRAPTSGVLQDLALQLGQWVPEGSLLGRIVQPEQLKAVLRVAEADATGIQSGQSVAVDVRSGMIAGRVTRKATGAVGGIIPVDVALAPRLPPGAVPDLNVDGTVQMDVMRNVLSIGRPALGARSTTVSLFKLVDNGRAAIRVRVRLGNVTTNRVEVASGLRPGDRVILSDMTAYAAAERVALK